ncbi:putative PAS/PAC sensor protein [Desulfovibrio sp. X2]|uniref:hybrid sensor histidine kinase/response regulator n=1 Tax=Desulfovibrio sp. X2 TaxID=941449 RepID=UPI0003588357|nr:response regulator [Desulfovibrio sp. X2]EPR37387.1 putative PAS/PAC sensor protein [Desulfovibrio sp. X2]
MTDMNDKATRRRLLLVDDEPAIRTMLSLSLKDRGYDVRTASSFDEGLATFREFAPDVVLTDIKMPGPDGIELLRRVKDENPDTEVVMLSGHGDLELAIKSLQLEAVDFVTKPIKDEILQIALRRAFEKQAMRRQIAAHTEDLERLVQEKSARLLELERERAVGSAVESLMSGLSDVTQSVTESVNADAEARESAGPSCFNDLPCFVSVHNRYLEIIASNRLYRERLGDMIGRNSWEVYSGRDGKGNGCPVWMALQTGRGQKSREVVLDKDGREIQVMVHTAPIPGRDGEPEFVIEFSVDVTEVGRLQDELKAAQQKYQEIFEASPAFISIHDLKYTLVESNKMFREHFGEGIGERCYQVYKHRERPCDECLVHRTLKEGHTVELETVVTDREDRPINVLIRTSPIRNTAGEIVQVMEMATDITQLRKLQDHLSSIGLMIGSMSHGVKGLLTALDGGMYRVDKGLARDDLALVADGWGTVKDKMARVRHMVLDILSYAKARSLNLQSVEVGAFARDVASIIGPRAERAGVRFSLELPARTDGPAGHGGLGAFEVDDVAFSAALVNLLENGVDACAEKPGDGPGSLRLRVGGDKESVYFEIMDNGVGMDRETREKMFTLFFSSKGHKGTGLGTYIAGHVVEQHGGRLRVESAPGKGTVVHVAMPRFRADGPGAAQDCAPLGRAGDGAAAGEA